jgi:hypothetical protein
VRSESRCALRYVDLVVSIEVTVEVCCCFTVFSAAKSAMYRDRPRALNELKTVITAFIKKHLTSRSAESVCE